MSELMRNANRRVRAWCDFHMQQDEKLADYFRYLKRPTHFRIAEYQEMQLESIDDPISPIVSVNYKNYEVNRHVALFPETSAEEDIIKILKESDYIDGVFLEMHSEWDMDYIHGDRIVITIYAAVERD